MHRRHQLFENGENSKIRRGGDVGKGVCLTYTDRYRNYDYMKAGISTNERPNE